MFKFVPDTSVSGFRVGLPDDLPGFSIDENGSVLRPVPAAPGASASGYGHYSNAPQTILPSDVNGQDVGAFVGGALGVGLGSMIPVPGVGTFLGGYVGSRLGRVLGSGTDFTADTMIDAAPLGANPVAP